MGSIALAVAALTAGAAIYLWPSAPTVRPVTIGAGQPMITAEGESVSFSFITPKVGWAAVTMPGERRLWIFATTDGANTWRRLDVIADIANAAPAPSLQFFDRTHGVTLSAADGLAYRTTDGGRTWAPVSLPPAATSVQFTDPSDGWATPPPFEALSTKLYRTSDGGATWSRLPDLPVRGYAEFLSPSEGWLAGTDGGHNVYTSADGGETWQVHNLPPSPCTDAKACPSDIGTPNPELLPGGGALAWDTSDGAAFVSLDLGRSWRYVASPPGIGDYLDISCQDSTHWWVIRTNTLYKTADAGESWSVVSNHILYDHLWPTILDANHAWAMVQAETDNGQRSSRGWSLEVTSDGGLTWKDAAVPVPH